MQNNINSSSIDGSDHKIIETTELKHPNGIAYHNGIVYVVDNSRCKLKSFEFIKGRSTMRCLTRLSNETMATKLIIISESLQRMTNEAASNLFSQQFEQVESQCKIYEHA